MCSIELRLMTKYFGTAVRVAQQPNGVTSLLQQAQKECPALSLSEALTAAHDDNTTFKDVREDTEVAQTGKVVGATHIPRGLLESAVDSKYGNNSGYTATFADPSRRFLLYCNSGDRSRLAGLKLKGMGFQKVATVGSFADWMAAADPVEHTGAATRKQYA